MIAIKCRYCGKSYPSSSEMRKRQCHCHPKGAWKGYCTPEPCGEAVWQAKKMVEKASNDARKSREDAAHRKLLNAYFRIDYKKHTPLLDCVLEKDGVDNEPARYKLQIRNSDLCQLSIDLADGINNQSKDAINTIYALRDGCDYVLNNPDAQKEGSLNTWIDRIKQLEDEVVGWEFWVSLYWLMKPIKEEKTWVEKTDFERDRENWNYWAMHSTAEVFHLKRVMPMLRALRVLQKEPDENDREAMREITSYVLSLPSKEKGFERCFEKMSKNIKEPKFWSVLYCLYWMELRPTPWSDKKVWPIPVVKKQSAPFEKQTPSIGSKAEEAAKIKCRDFVERLKAAYAKNFSPFKSLWTHHDESTLVFYKYNRNRKGATIEVAVLPEVTNVYIFIPNGSLEEIQAFVDKNVHLKRLFPEIVGQCLQRSKIPYADVPAFIDKVLAALRSPNAQVASNAESKNDAPAKLSCGDLAKKLQNTYLKNFAPFTKLWIYKEDTLVFDEYIVNGKRVAIDVGISQEEVSVTLFMRNGNLHDVQTVVNQNAQLKSLFTEVVAQRLRHSQIAYSDVPAFIDKILVALRSPVQQQEPKTSSTPIVKKVKSEPVVPVAAPVYNASEMLKTLRDITLGMKWRESAKKDPYWGGMLDDSLAVVTWQKRFQVNLACEFDLSSDKTHIYNGECWMECTMRFETKDGRTILNLWGEFWGYWLNGKQAKIDLTQPKVAPVLTSVEHVFVTAWQPFGVEGNIGHHENNLWFNVAIPLPSLDSIRDSAFGYNLRTSLAKVVHAFATLKPFCSNI